MIISEWHVVLPGTMEHQNTLEHLKQQKPGRLVKGIDRGLLKSTSGMISSPPFHFCIAQKKQCPFRDHETGSSTHLWWLHTKMEGVICVLYSPDWTSAFSQPWVIHIQIMKGIVNKAAKKGDGHENIQNDDDAQVFFIQYDNSKLGYIPQLNLKYYVIFHIFGPFLYGTETGEEGEEWIAISYGRDLQYIGRVVKESDSTVKVWQSIRNKKAWWRGGEGPCLYAQHWGKVGWTWSVPDSQETDVNYHLVWRVFMHMSLPDGLPLMECYGQSLVLMPVI